MAQRARPLSPFLHYRWQYTNTLSILHRITGVLLSLGFFAAGLLARRRGGRAGDATRRRVDMLGSPLAQLVLFGAAFSFCYHLLNGVRHLFFDLGHGFEPQDRADERLGRGHRRARRSASPCGSRVRAGLGGAA